MMIVYVSSLISYNPGYKPWAYIISKALSGGLITGGGGGEGLITGGILRQGKGVSKDHLYYLITTFIF